MVEADNKRAARRRAGDRGRSGGGLGVGVVVVERGAVDPRPEPHIDGGSVGGQIDGGAGPGERPHVGQVIAAESGADPEVVAGCARRRHST